MLLRVKAALQEFKLWNQNISVARNVSEQLGYRPPILLFYIFVLNQLCNGIKNLARWCMSSYLFQWRTWVTFTTRKILMYSNYSNKPGKFKYIKIHHVTSRLPILCSLHELASLINVLLYISIQTTVHECINFCAIYNDSNDHSSK